MNQNICKSSLWKGQNIVQSSEHTTGSLGSNIKSIDNDLELKNYINSSNKQFDGLVSGNLFDDKMYHANDKINDRSLNSSSFNQYNTQITTISTACDFKGSGEVDSETFLEGPYASNRSFINISKKSDQSMSHSSPSYANSNAHDSALIMKLLQQSKQSNDVTGSNLRINSNNSDMSSSNNSNSDEYLWYYLDPRHNVQGPFHDDQMFQWWSQGIYFQNSLLMRRKCDIEFSTLQDYSKRFNGVPFNRKDIRIPPLTESLSINHGNNFVSSKMFNNGQMPNHPQMHLNSQITEPSMLYQMFSGAPNSHVDEVAKLLHKINFTNRVANQLDQSHIIPPMQNGSDPYMYNDVSSSLSYVKPPQFNNQFQHAPVDCKSIPMESFVKQDRVPGPPWCQMPQAALMDSVWTTKNRDRIPATNHNAVWSQSNSDSVNNGQSILTNIFQENSKTKLSSAIHADPRQCNPMQDSWDNLDPAIIKMVPSASSQNVQKDILLPRQRTPPPSAAAALPPPPQLSSSSMMMAAATETSTNRFHSDNTKSVWAEMVRKTNSAANNCQKYKSGCNSENELFTNHSISPNQHKTSLTSNSSDENDHQSFDPSDKDLETLILWTKNYLENKPGLSGVDISTLVELLSSVESPYEVDALIRENVPVFDNIGEFVKMFLEKRRPLRQKIANDNQKKKSKSPPKAEENTKWQVKSKTQGSSKKKRKNNNINKN